MGEDRELTCTAVVPSKDLVDDGGGLGVRIQLCRQSLEAALLQPVHKVAQELVSIFLPPLSKVLPYNCVQMCVYTDTVCILLCVLCHIIISLLHCYLQKALRYATRQSKRSQGRRTF